MVGGAVCLEGGCRVSQHGGSLAGQTLAHGERAWYFTIGRLVLLSQLPQVYS